MTEIRTLLRGKLPTTWMSFPGDPDFDRARATWNIRNRYRPLGIVRPTSVQEIRTVLDCVRGSADARVVARSGGHSFEGLSLGGEDDKALVIDMVKFNEIEIRSDEQVAIVGGGVLLGDLYREAFNQGGFMVPAGSCVAVGIGGQLQCGGYGHYSRTAGILTDQILQVEIVTADGELRVADKNTNPDLFWAIRGNGTGSFGIITQAKIKLTKAPRAVARFSYKWKRSDIDFAEHFTLLQNYALSMPRTANPWICIWLGEVEFVGAVLTDTETDRDAVLADLEAALPPSTDKQVEAVTFLESVRDFGLTQTSAPWYSDLNAIEREHDEHLRYMTIRAGFITEPLNAECINHLAEVVARQPLTGSRIQLVSLNPDDGPLLAATAIPVRGATWAMGMSSWFELADFPDEDSLIQAGRANDIWLNEAYNVFRPYSAGGYIGDDDMAENATSEDISTAYWGNHLARLSELKRKYDPANLFHHKLSIPPNC
ncbi:FAD-binding protein [Nocardia sp. NPDC051570]|uniref:FAD-dependent oxidoreductase n=1 Tax=Nocardia sp. NPDC051570 TaxID=3364324 RepID=UPI0037A7C2C0